VAGAVRGWQAPSSESFRNLRAAVMQIANHTHPASIFCDDALITEVQIGKNSRVWMEIPARHNVFK
jgi:hypothetical protein